MLHYKIQVLGGPTTIHTPKINIGIFPKALFWKEIIQGECGCHLQGQGKSVKELTRSTRLVKFGGNFWQKTHY